MTVSKDTLIIMQILSARNSCREENNIDPDVVFVHPSLFSEKYSEIGPKGDRLKVFESEFIEKGMFILSVHRELGSINPFYNRVEE